jgi:para-nitrobenzyl esterase
MRSTQTIGVFDRECFMRSQHYFIVALLFFFVASSALASTVRTESGWVEGETQGRLTVFKGMPFASPPVGPLRWQGPQAAQAWSDVKRLDHFGPRCMQRGMYPANAPAEPMSEDCLYLNLWVPPSVAGEKLPVMVWIYGGGLDNGSGSTPLYAGDVLARQGVIVVTFNYRLGVFGFLAHSQLAQESAGHTTGNYGLLDQLAALAWVHRNIAAFGGDPSRVTVFGQSSGSISISALSVSPLAKGLFRYAIGESGGLFEPMGLVPDLTESGAEEEGAAFMKRAGATSIKDLRHLPATTLLNVPFTPAIIMDGAVIDIPPAEAYRRGRINPEAFLIGSNHDEGVIFLTGKLITPEKFDDVLARDFPPWLIKLAAPSPGKTEETAYDAAQRFEGDVRFHWDMWTWARSATHAGIPAYLYSFVHPTKCSAIEGCVTATRHGDEMPYVFGHDLGSRWSLQDHDLSRLMVACWTQFAKTGSPENCGLPVWPSYRDQKSMMLMYAHPHVSMMRPDFTLRRLDQIYVGFNGLAKHPIVSVFVVLLVFCATILIIALLVRRGIRWKRLRRKDVR